MNQLEITDFLLLINKRRRPAINNGQIREVENGTEDN